MKKSVLLKIQLAEAAKYALKEELPYKRLAVIMLDNFIELQLSSVIQNKPLVKHITFTAEERRKEQKEFEKALKSFDALLKLAEKRDIITGEERYQLAFCHTVRNNLYHHAHEELLLMEVALIILHEIIMRKQPDWRNGSMWYSYGSKDTDPFYQEDKEKLPVISHNTEEEWTNFLKKHFVLFNENNPSIQALLSQSIIEKIDEIRDCYEFIGPEYHIYFPWAKDWDFNDYVMNYTFQRKLKEMPEGVDRTLCQDERLYEVVEQHAIFASDWKHKDMKRVDAIEWKAKEMIKLPASKALERYINLQPDLLLIYYALQEAASDLDQSVQLAIDIARGK
jgi:hypothetical protein